MPFGSRWRWRGGAFTLIELLTVIAIIAVLASLLLTTLSTSKKKAQAAFCTSNLHQFSLALNLYMEDYGGKRPMVDNLATNRYLPSAQSLLCPRDLTTNWGSLIQSNTYPMVPVFPNSIKHSYLIDPLIWSDAEWGVVKQAGPAAGVAACQLHGLGTQNKPDIHAYSGLLLRTQLDASSSRRQLFWSAIPGPIVLPYGTNAYYALQIFFDDPANWQSFR